MHALWSLVNRCRIDGHWSKQQHDMTHMSTLATLKVWYVRRQHSIVCYVDVGWFCNWHCAAGQSKHLESLQHDALGVAFLPLRIGTLAVRSIFRQCRSFRFTQHRQAQQGCGMAAQQR